MLLSFVPSIEPISVIDLILKEYAMLGGKAVRNPSEDIVTLLSTTRLYVLYPDWLLDGTDSHRPFYGIQIYTGDFQAFLKECEIVMAANEENRPKKHIYELQKIK